MFSDVIQKQYELFRQLSLNCCTFVTVKCSQLKCSNVKKPDYVIARLTPCDITFEESLGPGAVSHLLKGALCFPLGYFSVCLNNPLSKIEHRVFLQSVLVRPPQLCDACAAQMTASNTSAFLLQTQPEQLRPGKQQQPADCPSLLHFIDSIQPLLGL